LPVDLVVMLQIAEAAWLKWCVHRPAQSHTKAVLLPTYGLARRWVGLWFHNIFKRWHHPYPS